MIHLKLFFFKTFHKSAMSHFPAEKSKDKNNFPKKCQFYVEFLGWMECRGLRGQKYTDPIMRELRQRHQRMEALPKLTIEVNRKHLTITQDVEDKSKKGIKKIKFPSIPAQDITYVRQATHAGDKLLEDTVACIYLGYMPRTQRYVHVHVYRFDEARTATHFTNQMAALIEANFEHIREVEIDLSNMGEIDDPRMMSFEDISEHPTTDSAIGSGSSASTDADFPTYSSSEIDPDLQSLRDVQTFDSVTHELKFRLQMADVPLLLPPKDYDTIRRAHGNLDQINKRRCLNLNIVGEHAVGQDERTDDNENMVGKFSSSSNTAKAHMKSVADKKEAPKTAPSANLNLLSVPSPHHDHSKLIAFKDANMISQKPKTQTNYNAFRQSLHLSNKSDFHGRDIPRSGHHSEDKSSNARDSFAELVYPPKITSPPIIQAMHNQPQNIEVDRQSSDTSKFANIFNNYREATPVRHYRSSSNDEIYAMPFKNNVKSSKQMLPWDDLPPDYNDDFSEQPVRPEKNQRLGQSYFTRTMSDDPNINRIGSKMNFRPDSADLQIRQRYSQNVVLEPHHHHDHETVVSPFVKRIAASRRK